MGAVFYGLKWPVFGQSKLLILFGFHLLSTNKDIFANSGLGFSIFSSTESLEDFLTTEIIFGRFSRISLG